MKKRFFILISAVFFTVFNTSNINAQYNSYSQSEFSTYSTSDCENCFLTKIENVGSYTKVTFKYAATNYSTIYIAEGGYILDKRTNEHYMLRDAKNINIGNRHKTDVEPGNILTYTLYYDQIPEFSNFLDIMETPQPGGFNFYNIRLNGSGTPNVYTFNDNSADFIRQNNALIQRNIQARDERRETNAAIGIGVGVAAAAAAAAIAIGVTQGKAGNQDYRLQITNRHTDARKIYVAGEYIGIVPARSTKTFTLPRTKYGRIDSEQASGYLFFPNRENGYINQKPGPDQLISFTF